MKVVAIIPARMAATRFPGKPLALIGGVPLVEHVRRRVMMCRLLSDVIVATCDAEIKAAVEAAGGKAVMTSSAHERCTDRIAEAAAVGADADIVVNVQGDEPLVMPRMIEEVARPLIDDPGLQAANLMSRIRDEEEFLNPNAPKVVANLAGDLLYISREPIPSRRRASNTGRRGLGFKQLGIISFRGDFLQVFARLSPTPLEIIESVDMLRAVEHGYRVRMVETEGTMIGVDVPGDVQKVEAELPADPLFKLYSS